MENKLFWVPQLVHRDEDKQKCHIISGLETENGDSMEWKIQRHFTYHMLHTDPWPLFTQREGKTATT